LEHQVIALRDEGFFPVQPWEINPRVLISWFDVLQFSAGRFFWCGRALRSIRADCYIGSVGLLQGKAAFNVAMDLDDRARESACSKLIEIGPEFKRIGLLITAETAQELVTELKEETRHSFDWLQSQVDAIERLAEKELKGRFFLYIPPERAKFWPLMDKPNVFGDVVASKFPSTTFDACNSGVCLATMMSTAAVFHLMRVLETGLTVLGSVFNVSLAHTNWGNAIEQIESKIRDMHKDPAWKALPDYKEQQEFYAQAASHFAILKDAWRNQTMHARAKYTEDEGERIFENVKSFMQKLAERLQE
jgi:hypothetical protein